MKHAHVCPICAAFYSCSKPYRECSGLEPCAKCSRTTVDDPTCMVCGKPASSHPQDLEEDDEWPNEKSVSWWYPDFLK